MTQPPSNYDGRQNDRQNDLRQNDLLNEVRDLSGAVSQLNLIYTKKEDFNKRSKTLYTVIGVLTALVIAAVGTLFILQGNYHGQENKLVTNFETFVNRSTGSCLTRNKQAVATNDLITGLLTLQAQEIKQAGPLTKAEKAEIAAYTRLLNNYNRVEGIPVKCQSLTTLTK